MSGEALQRRAAAARRSVAAADRRIRRRLEELADAADEAAMLMDPAQRDWALTVTLREREELWARQVARQARRIGDWGKKGVPRCPDCGKIVAGHGRKCDVCSGRRARRELGYSF